jgi:hypothetical protein
LSKYVAKGTVDALIEGGSADGLKDEPEGGSVSASVIKREKARLSGILRTPPKSIP